MYNRGKPAQIARPGMGPQFSNFGARASSGQQGRSEMSRYTGPEARPAGDRSRSGGRNRLWGMMQNQTTRPNYSRGAPQIGPPPSINPPGDRYLGPPPTIDPRTRYLGPPIQQPPANGRAGIAAALSQAGPVKGRPGGPYLGPPVQQSRGPVAQPGGPVRYLGPPERPGAAPQIGPPPSINPPGDRYLGPPPTIDPPRQPGFGYQTINPVARRG